jgi:hypothetical protein
LAYSTAKGKPDQGMIVIIKPSKNLIIKCNWYFRRDGNNWSSYLYDC